MYRVLVMQDDRDGWFCSEVVTGLDNMEHGPTRRTKLRNLRILNERLSLIKRKTRERVLRLQVQIPNSRHRD